MARLTSFSELLAKMHEAELQEEGEEQSGIEEEKPIALAGPEDALVGPEDDEDGDDDCDDDDDDDGDDDDWDDDAEPA